MADPSDDSTPAQTRYVIAELYNRDLKYHRDNGEVSTSLDCISDIAEVLTEMSFHDLAEEIKGCMSRWAEFDSSNDKEGSKARLNYMKICSGLLEKLKED